MAKVNQLQVIENGTSFSAVNKYLGDRKIEATFSIRRSEGEARYLKTSVIDFSSVSEEELLNLSMYAVKVKLQALMRALDPALMIDANTLSTVDVNRDILEAPSKSSDPVSAAVRSLMKTGLTEAEAMAVLDVAHRKVEARKNEGKKVAQAA